jgi:hypothetical protein
LKGSLSGLPDARKDRREPKLLDVENTAFNTHFTPANESVLEGLCLTHQYRRLPLLASLLAL